MLGTIIAASLMLTPGGDCYTPSYGYSYGNSYSNNYGNWSYSPYYLPGYTYYSASYGYPAGYWYYNKSYPYYRPIYIYQPVAFSTYQSAAIVNTPLVGVEQRTAVQATGFGVAAVPAIPTVNVGTVATVGVNPNLQVQGQPQVSRCDQALASFDARMARIEKALTAMSQGNGGGEQVPPPPQQSPKSQAPANAEFSALVAKGKAAFFTSCSKCHLKAGNPKQPMLFNGKELATLDCKTLLTCYKDILSGRMPKESKLSPEDGNSIMAYLETIQASDVAKALPAAPAKK